MSSIIKTNVNTAGSATLTPQTELRAKLLTEANDDFRELYNQIRDTLLVEEQNVIRSRYAIGELVYDMDMDESKYGSKAVQRMEEVIGYDRSVIYNALGFVRKYTKEDMEALLELRTSNGQALLWTHVTHLLRVQEVAVREELTQTILDKDLSPTELLILIQKIHGKGPGRQSNAGKPMARPKSVRGYIDQQWTLVEQLLRRKDKVWNGFEKKGDKSFFDVIDDTPTDKLDDAVLTDMEQLQKLFEKAAFELDEYATKLLEVRKRVERVKRRAAADEEEVKPKSRRKASPVEEPKPSEEELADADTLVREIEEEKVDEVDDNEKPISKPEPLVSKAKARYVRQQPVF